MSKSKIEWTEETWNPVKGCKAVSPGCRDCYAGTQARRLINMGPSGESYLPVVDASPFKGKQRKGAKAWNGRAVFVPDQLAVPLRRKKPTVYMAPSMSDFFHEDVSFEQIAAILGVMAATPQHTFQVLTKRPERLLAFLRWVAAQSTPGCPAASVVAVMADRYQRTGEWDAVASPAWPLPNVWFGTSVEDQRRAEERLPLLAQLRAMGWHTFASVEPLLGPIVGGLWAAAEWVILGGESGPTARPCGAQWMRRVRDEARGVGCRVFVKQLGLRYVDGVRRVYGAGVDTDGLQQGFLQVLKSRKGNDPAEWPEDLRVFELPEAMAAALGGRR